VRPLPLRGLLFRLGESVTSDAEEKVPTGGELTLFEAVGRSACLPFAMSLVAGRGCSA
jgi:hypothetical protein